MPNNPSLQHFWDKIEKTDFCWNWKGALTWGYGYYQYAGKHYRSHRFSYELLVGSIPKGLVIDHICRNKACVNPKHLEPVTIKENLLRGNTSVAVRAYRKTCPKGHIYDKIDCRGSKICSICAKESAKRCYRRKYAS